MDKQRRFQKKVSFGSDMGTVTHTDADITPENVEEQWRRRIQVLESLYDTHVTKLQKELLSEKRYARLFDSVKNYNSRLKDQVQEFTYKNLKLQNKINTLESVLEKREREERKIKQQLEKTKLSEHKLMKDLNSKERENQEIKYKVGRYNNNLDSLQRKGKKLEEQLNEIQLERKDLQGQLKEKEKESLQLKYQSQKINNKKKQVRESEQSLQIARGKFESETDEEKLLKLKQEIKSLVGQLKNETILKKDISRKKNILEKSLLSTQVDFDRVSTKLENKEIENLHWKQEFEAMTKAKEAQGTSSKPLGKISTTNKKESLGKSIKDKQLASRLSQLENKIRKLDAERELLLNSMRSLEALQRNQIKLHQSILDYRTKLITTNANHFIPTTTSKPIDLKQRRKSVPTISPSSASFPQKSLPKIIEYNKKIENLDKELIKFKNKYNLLYAKLKKQDELRRVLSQTQKALFNVEKEKVVAENLFDGIISRLFTSDPNNSIGTKLLKQRILSNLDVIEELRKDQNQQLQIPEDELLNIKQIDMNENAKFFKTIEKGEDSEELRKLRRDMTLLERRQAVFNDICMKNEEAAAAKEKEQLIRKNKTFDSDESEDEEQVQTDGGGEESDISILPIDKLLGQIGIEDTDDDEEESGDNENESTDGRGGSKKSSKSSSSSSSINLGK